MADGIDIDVEKLLGGSPQVQEEEPVRQSQSKDEVVEEAGFFQPEGDPFMYKISRDNPEQVRVYAPESGDFSVVPLAKIAQDNPDWVREAVEAGHVPSSVASNVMDRVKGRGAQQPDVTRETEAPTEDTEPEEVEPPNMPSADEGGVEPPVDEDRPSGEDQRGTISVGQSAEGDSTRPQITVGQMLSGGGEASFSAPQRNRTSVNATQPNARGGRGDVTVGQDRAGGSASVTDAVRSAVDGVGNRNVERQEMVAAVMRKMEQGEDVSGFNKEIVDQASRMQRQGVAPEDLMGNPIQRQQNRSEGAARRLIQSMVAGQ
jgi:hypothetical protein